MNTSEKGSTRKIKFDKTLREIAIPKEVPKSAYVLILLLYFITSIVVVRISIMQGNVYLFGYPIRLSAFAGVLTSLANISIFMLVFFFKKTGFVTAIVVLSCQFPAIFYNMIIHRNFSSLPGVFSNVFTIAAVIIIYVSGVKVGQVQERVRRQAVTDMLTGLPNRFACTELMNSLIDSDEEFAIVSIDLNNFKSINDTMGHSFGDKSLIEVARRWKKLAESNQLSTSSFVVRFGGDEYALVIRSYSSEDEILETIRKFEEVLEEKMTIDECDYYFTAAFGYATFPDDANASDTLISYADSAMHEIKRRNNSNHILRFTPELLEYEQTIEMERIIRNALDNDNVFYLLQPQYDINHKLRGFEALARINDPEQGMISPGRFIPVAEKIGLIDKIDMNVFKKSAAFLGQIIKETNADITLSINISVRHLMKNNFIEEIKDVLEMCDFPADHLEIEITESIMIDSVDKALECIRRVKDMGMKIAIDDFGTGYSSLSYLNKFPADLLKVDKSFIDKMNTNESSKQYVAMIISIGHIMNLDVISEGVESPDQIETLKDIGCDYIQGFIWGKPVSSEEAEEIVRKNMSE